MKQKGYCFVLVAMLQAPSSSATLLRRQTGRSPRGVRVLFPMASPELISGLIFLEARKRVLQPREEKRGQEPFNSRA